MRQSISFVTASLCAASTACPAEAKTKADEIGEARTLMHAYAKCVVKKKGDKASDAIVANSGNSDIVRDYASLIDGDCLGQVAGNVQMAFGGDLYRYALADALVNQRFASKAETDFSNRLPLAHLLPPDRTSFDAELAKTKSKRKRVEMEDGYKKAVSIAWVSRYGECVVREQPAKARLWLLTPPGGPEETSRINELRPAFSNCLAGGTLTFNRTTMRGTVAINYYRLAMATPVPGKTP